MTNAQINNHSSPHPPRIAYIDGLRGVAVLIILLFHLDVNVLKGGFIGVDIFFVISGYLITQIIARELNSGHFSFAGFYARRIRRIFPALFTMLFAASMAAILVLGPLDYAAFFKALRFTSAQFSNILFSHQVDYFAVKHDTSPLLHTWSLGVEEQFYFVWPLLLYAAHRFCGVQKMAAVLLLVMVASLGLSEYWVRTSTLQAFYLLPSRAWELAVGGIIALQIIPPLRSKLYADVLAALGLILIGLAVFLTNKDSFPGLWALLPCVGAGFIFYAAQTDTGRVHKILSVAPLTGVGLISYSLYLWHWPLIVFYKSYVGDALSITAQITLFAVSFIMAFLSYLLVEKPTAKWRLKPVFVIAAGVTIAVVFILASNVLKHSDDANWRMTTHVDKVETVANDYFKICAEPRGVLNIDKCIIGPHKDSYEVVLSGDSHAAHYAPAVLAWAKSRGLTVRLMLRGACQAWVPSVLPPKKGGEIDTDCLKIRDEFYDVLGTQKSVKYVFLALKLPKDNADNRAALAKVAAYHKTTIFLGAVPIFERNPHDCRIKNHLLISAIFPKNSEDESCQIFDKAHNDAQLTDTLTGFVPLLKAHHIPYFDPRPAMQTAFDAAGHFLYMDVDHLNQYGGDYLGGALIEFMNTYSSQK